PRDQDHRVLGVRALVGGNDVGGYEFCPPRGRWERLDEHHRIAGIALLHARIGDAVLGLQALLRDAADARHGVTHLVEYGRHRALARAIGPGQTELARQIDDDLQI